MLWASGIPGDGSMAIATWWTKVQSEQAAGVSRYFGAQGATRKGSFGGPCFHVTCQNGTAAWFNKLDGRYYCDACAAAINAACEQRGEMRDCSKHF